MDKTIIYSDILAKVLREEGALQPKHGTVKIISVCDQEAHQYLLIANGWENKRRINSILFHAGLENGKVIIEADNTEEGLKQKLRTEGIPSEDVMSASQLSEEAEPAAA